MLKCPACAKACGQAQHTGNKLLKKTNPTGLATTKLTFIFGGLNVLYSTENVQVEKPGKILKLIRGYTIMAHGSMTGYTGIHLTRWRNRTGGQHFTLIPLMTRYAILILTGSLVRM
jgi:hypothetical protein